MARSFPGELLSFRLASARVPGVRRNICLYWHTRNRYSGVVVRWEKKPRQGSRCLRCLIILYQIQLEIIMRNVCLEHSDGIGIYLTRNDTVSSSSETAMTPDQSAVEAFRWSPLLRHPSILLIGQDRLIRL